MNTEIDELTEYKRLCLSLDPPDVLQHLHDDPAELLRQRQNYDKLFQAFPVARPADMDIRDELLRLPTHDIPLRWFQRRSDGDAQACILYAHGGGFIAGTLEVADGIAIDLCQRLGVTVLTFDYRLAPEHIYPAPLEDCYSVLLHATERARANRIDPGRIIISGESCGGNFSAALPLLSRDRGGPRLLAQAPINPVFDVHRWAQRQVTDCDPDFQHEMHQYTSLYLGSNLDVTPAYASPLCAGDLAGLPPAFIWAVDTDPLSREADAYGRRLREAGVPCHVHIQPHAVHGCLRARHRFSFAARAFDTLCQGLAWLLGAAAEPTA